MGYMREQHYFGTATGDQFLSSLFLADESDVPVRPPARPPPVVGSDDNGAAVDPAQMVESKRGKVISKRLMELGLAFFEDFGRPLNSASTEAVTAFFRGWSNAVIPAFSAEPTGHVLATWRKGRDVLTVRFVDEGSVHFALAREIAGSSNLKRSWGVATRADLSRAGAPFESLVVV
jgi:hypothetical protein